MAVFIVSIDGPDLSGKTTITNLVVELLKREKKRGNSLRGVTIKRAELPTNDMVTGAFTDILRSIKGEVSAEEFALAYALDHLHYYRLRVMPLERLKERFLIVQERSLLTTYIYQGLMGGADLKWLKEVNRYCKAIPSLTIILKVSLEELLRRRRVEGRCFDAFEEEALLKRQVEVYYNLPKELREEFNVHYVNAEDDAFVVAAAIRDIIVKEVKAKGFVGNV